MFGMTSFLFDQEIVFLFRFPNFAVSNTQRNILSEAISLVGSWVEVENRDALETICHSIRALDENKTIDS